MAGSPADHYIKIIKYLNTNNAILSKINTQLVIAARSRKQVRNAKKAIGKARVLGKEDADKLQAEIEAKEAAEIAHKAAIGQKKKEQALKKAQEEANKAERAQQRALAKNARDTNAEMGRMAKIQKSLFT